MEPRVYVVILNYKNWKDTLECLESVFRIEYCNFEVIVCDNASGDGSADRIRDWAKGELAGVAGDSKVPIPLNSPPSIHPIEVVTPGAEGATRVPSGRPALVLLESKVNLGYAGGNNLALRYALGRGDLEYAWILNNDLVVTPAALREVVAFSQSRPKVGLCGSLVRYYYRPAEVQAYGGGNYNRWMGVSSYPSAPPLDEGDALDYTLGAATLVSKRFLEKVGLMSEDFFLYFEETDWAVRGRPNFRLGYCPESVIYHKEGGSTGISAEAGKKSPMADYYIMRNRVLFTRTYYPLCLPSVLLGIGYSVLLRIWRRQWTNVRAIFRALLNVKLGGRVPSENHPVRF